MRHAKGPLLTIDVGDRTTSTESIDDVLAAFIGGRGICTKLATDRTPPDVEPFGPDNRVYFATGPMQQSTMSFTGRMNVTGVSPLTGGLLSSNAGGFLSRNFVATGYSAVELVGASDDPLVVHVTDDGVEFEAVPDLALATVPEVTAHVEADRGLDETHIAAIGPAGDNQVRFAAIMTTESRAFGRGGLGAVLGSKNVKAITFEGDSAPELELEFPADAGEIHREAATSDHIMKRQGTTSVTDLANEVDGLPTRYFSETSFEGVEGINGDAVESKKYKKGTCSSCAFACKLPTKDEARGVETEGPEYETVMAFGSNAGVDDVVDVMQSNELCDNYGLDTISCGDTIAAYLQREDAFGDAELIHELIEQIAYREGIGDVLAEGVDRCHEELGVENWSVKGMEFPGHEGRRLHGQALSYAVSNRGADHMYSTFYAWEYPLVATDQAFDPSGISPEKVREIIRQENTRALEDCGVVCRFSRGVMSASRFESLFDADFEALLEVGSAVVELERAFNNERGFDRSVDTLPYDVEGLEGGIDAYYEARGWTADGIVPEGVSGVAPADD
ncbi:MAG: aldehyde ferredoxin oxidoreductase family protein [Halobacteriota archaeon]